MSQSNFLAKGDHRNAVAQVVFAFSDCFAVCDVHTRHWRLPFLFLGTLWRQLSSSTFTTTSHFFPSWVRFAKKAPLLLPPARRCPTTPAPALVSLLVVWALFRIPTRQISEASTNRRAAALCLLLLCSRDSLCKRKTTVGTLLVWPYEQPGRYTLKNTLTLGAYKRKRLRDLTNTAARHTG